MTSTPVMGSAAVQFLDASQATSNNKDAGNLDFKSFMTGQGMQYQNDIVTKTDNSKIEAKETVKEEKSFEPKKDISKTVKENKTETREVKSSDVSEVKDAVNEVVEKIDEELDVSPEEILEAIENLGLNPLALLDVTSLSDIVVEVMDIEDPILLATNEDLMTAIEDIEDFIGETIEDVCKELDIKPEEFQKAVEDAKTLVPEEITEELPADAMTIEDNNDAKVSPVEIEEAASKSPILNEVEITISKEDKTVKGNEEVNIHNFSVHTKAKEDSQLKVEGSEESGAFKKFSQESHSASESILSFAENLVKETVQALNDSADVPTFTQANAADIINQITESIKADFSNEVTQISMKLHPETLGNVAVKITENNEGVMTARFIAENDSVKGIIESQALVLKENLESKGVTIEAVEVMVASHEFDENLNQERNSEEASKTSKKGIRRINLDAEIEEEVENDDDVRIAREMMAQNGSTIDYMA